MNDTHDDTDEFPTRTCKSCGSEWRGAHVCPPKPADPRRPRPTDPNWLFGRGGREDAAIWGP